MARTGERIRFSDNGTSFTYDDYQDWMHWVVTDVPFTAVRVHKERDSPIVHIECPSGKCIKGTLTKDTGTGPMDMRELTLRFYDHDEDAEMAEMYLTNRIELAMAAR